MLSRRVPRLFFSLVFAPGISREKVVSKIPVSRDFYARVPGNIVVLLKPLFGGCFCPFFPQNSYPNYVSLKIFFYQPGNGLFLSFLHDYFV